MSLMWLPDTEAFVRINLKEIWDMASSLCKKGWDKRDFSSYVLIYLLDHKMHFDREYRNEHGRKSKLSTYLYSTIQGIKIKYYYDIIKDQKQYKTKKIESRRGLIPCEYIEAREQNLNFKNASETVLNIKMFKKYMSLKKDMGKRRTKRAIEILGYLIRGYGNKEIAEKLGITDVSVSIIKRKLKENYESFRDEYFREEQKEKNMCGCDEDFNDKDMQEMLEEEEKITCDLRVSCPNCEALIEVKNLKSDEKTETHLLEEPEHIIQPVVLHTTKAEVTDEHRKKVVNAYLKYGDKFDALILAHDIGIGQMQVAAIKAHCHSSLGGEKYINKYKD